MLYLLSINCLFNVSNFENPVVFNVHLIFFKLYIIYRYLVFSTWILKLYYMSIKHAIQISYLWNKIKNDGQIYCIPGGYYENYCFCMMLWCQKPHDAIRLYL